MLRRIAIASLALIALASVAGAQPTTIAWRPPTGCTTGQSIVYSTVTNRWSCGSGGLTNSAGANVLTKSNGTNLVASLWTDDGTTTLYNTNKFSITAATGNTAIAGTLDVTGLLTATAGLTTPANVTTTGTGALVVAGTATIAGVLDVNNDLAKFGSGVDGYIYVTQNGLGAYYGQDSDDLDFWVNERGYNNGTTRRRDFKIGDGQGALACEVTGSTKALNCVGGLTENGTAVLSGAITDNTIPKGSGGNLVDSLLSESGAEITLSGNAFIVNDGSSTRVRLVSTAGVNYIQSGINGTGGSSAPLVFSNMNYGAEWGRFDTSGNFSVTGNLSTDANLTAGNATSDTHTISGAVTHADDGNAYAITSTPSAATSDLAAMNAVMAGTLDATASGRVGYGIIGDSHATRSAGANNVTNYGAYLTASGGQVNRALLTAEGDVLLNVTSGSAQFYGQMFAGDTANSSISSNLDVLTIGNTGTGQTTSGTSLVSLAHSGSHDTTAGAIRVNGLKIAMTNTESAGGNVLTSVGLDVSVTGGDTKLAAHLKTGTTSAVSPPSGTTVIIDQADGTPNYLALRGNNAMGLYFTTTSADRGYVRYSSDTMSLGTATTARQAIASTGAISFGDTAGTAISDNVSAVTIGNTGTGQSTSGVALISGTHSGSFTTAGGNVTYYGANIAVSATESAGGNVLTGVALRLSATNGDDPMGLIVDDGRSRFDTSVEINESVSVYGRLYLAKTADDSYGNQIVVDTDDPPVVSSCGTSPSITGGDTAGVVTVGSGTATSCTVTFENTYLSNPPACTLTSEANNAVPLYFSSKSTSAFTVTTSTGANLAGQKFDYICIGVSGVVAFSE